MGKLLKAHALAQKHASGVLKKNHDDLHFIPISLFFSQAVGSKCLIKCRQDKSLSRHRDKQVDPKGKAMKEKRTECWGTCRFKRSQGAETCVGVQLAEKTRSCHAENILAIRTKEI